MGADHVQRKGGSTGGRGQNWGESRAVNNIEPSKCYEIVPDQAVHHQLSDISRLACAGFSVTSLRGGFGFRPPAREISYSILVPPPLSADCCLAVTYG